ncbi:LysE family translocator [Tenacibaculum finnmarkense genomovar finnmarkense]|uniref:LysE family translocator n=1 Tax=Tenacibaculum finnmarkense TaxID=2781243 RepID=UPI001E4D8AA6|nr:LysE family translocator [Tenacibaculum finnmarkense]MCD8417613.1 LysE family translocator [Tenacibaculum finnmarkense genomovar finnmarkense]MCG8185949.1 LysE family translocator [Tenacibaculum finnmarkense genomovar finnmarkense]MCG8202551.1 LysE family translocator [Tenacibaculum finnmarkense genomovar finnmarkense]MCG8209790.1 LysE family translocator [Tenacibaculum finnmarkense genomovar finnmarkense]MCG8212752.1 LysE family translocator [Tenacibaculum finnmarkense genomovar finnmarken
MLEILSSFLITTAILAISPGPDNIFVLTQSIVNGKKYGLATVFGLMTGCIIHTTLVAFGISELIKQQPNLFFSIKLLGAGYLLYLAYQVYKSDAKISLSTDNLTDTKKSTGKLFQKGFWMNVLNPKVTIFFLAFFPQFLFSKTLSTVIQFYILGGIFIVVSFFIFSAITILAGSLSVAIKKNAQIGVYLKWAQIIVFVSIAMLILR